MVVLVFLGVRSSEFFKHTSFCATELIFFLFIYIAWSRTVWVTVISLSCYFISVQFIPYLTTVFNFAFVVFPPRATKVNVINKWLLYRGIGVSTAVLGRSHIAVGNATIGVNVFFALRLVGGNIHLHLIGKFRQIKDLLYGRN